MKKILLLLAALTLALSGCSSETRLDPDNPTTLTIWHVYGNHTKSPLNDLILQFNNTVGRKEGVLINVTSVSDVSVIDEALDSAAKKKPGTPPLPDLFTVYPRAALHLGTDKLLCWDDYFTAQEQKSFVPEFLEEGKLNGKLYILPTVKSSEVLFVNKTLFNRFAAVSGQAQLTDKGTNPLQTYEDLFAISNTYYDWSNGKTLFQFNDYYNYLLVSIASLGGSFIKNGKIDLYSKEFMDAYMPLAKAAIYGGLNMEKGYASDRWKTGELLMHVGSTAGLLHVRNDVTYPNNTKEKIAAITLPYPRLRQAGENYRLMQRGTGLCALKSSDERRNKAASIFAHWLAEPKQNLFLATSAGYLPSNIKALNTLYADTSVLKDPRTKELFDTLKAMDMTSTFVHLPVYPNGVKIQKEFEKAIRTKFIDAHEQYTYSSNHKRDEALLEQLSQNVLKQLRSQF